MGTNLTIDTFGERLYLEMQNQVSLGKSEVKYLCECYDRLRDQVCFMVLIHV